MRVLFAPDKFAGTMSAAAAASAMAAGWSEVRPADETVELPIADGGEGTLDVLAASVAGSRRMTATVADPRGRPVDADWLRLPDGRAVVEVAQACGLRRLATAELDPERASTWGVGQLVRAAVEAGAREVLVALGGTATVDAGAGMAAAIGHEHVLAEGSAPSPANAGPGDVARVGRSVEVMPTVEVAADVRNPLLGPHGAAKVFGPQKGATPEAVCQLEEALRHYADVVERDLEGGPWRDLAGAGAGGGLAFAFTAFFGANIVSGASAVGRLLRLDELLTNADLVVTGEGSLDAQSVQGKAPAHVVERARAHGVPVLAVAGRLADGVESLFDRAVELGPKGLTHATALTRERSRELARDLHTFSHAKQPLPSERSP